MGPHSRAAAGGAGGTSLDTDTREGRRTAWGATQWRGATGRGTPPPYWHIEVGGGYLEGGGEVPEVGILGEVDVGGRAVRVVEAAAPVAEEARQGRGGNTQLADTPPSRASS